MRHLLAVPLVAATLAGPVALPAHALPKTCNLLSDPADDTYFVAREANQKSAALDVRSVDLATGRSKIVVVMRLGSTASTDNALVNGGNWSVDVHFKNSKSQHTFTKNMKRPSEGGAVTYGFRLDGNNIAGVVGTTDATSITWTLPKSAIPSLRKPKAVVTEMFASTLGLMTHDYAPDGGSFGPVKYQDQQPSCVRAG